MSFFKNRPPHSLCFYFERLSTIRAAGPLVRYRYPARLAQACRLATAVQGPGRKPKRDVTRPDETQTTSTSARTTPAHSANRRDVLDGQARRADRLRQIQTVWKVRSWDLHHPTLNATANAPRGVRILVHGSCEPPTRLEEGAVLAVCVLLARLCIVLLRALLLHQRQPEACV